MAAPLLSMGAVGRVSCQPYYVKSVYPVPELNPQPLLRIPEPPFPNNLVYPRYRVYLEARVIPVPGMADIDTHIEPIQP